MSEIESRSVFCWLDNILRLVCRVSLLSVGAHVDGECNVCEVFRRNNFCYCNYSLLITTPSPRLNMVAATAYLLLAGYVQATKLTNWGRDSADTYTKRWSWIKDLKLGRASLNAPIHMELWGGVGTSATYKLNKIIQISIMWRNE